MSDIQPIPDQLTDTARFLRPVENVEPFDWYGPMICEADVIPQDVLDADEAERDWLYEMGDNGFFESDSPTFDRWPTAAETTTADLIADYGTGENDR